MLFIYDDSGHVPEGIRRIIGADSFGEIVKRKRRLADLIQAEVESVLDCRYVRVGSEGQLDVLTKEIARFRADEKVFRMPSSVFPVSDQIFRSLIAKLPYALDQVLYGNRSSADSPSLLLRDDALRVLSAKSLEDRQRALTSIEAGAVRVGDEGQFLDISELSAFLAFMAGATEARHFNRTLIADRVFRKRSANKEKMRGEYKYFHIADPPMKRFLLPTFYSGEFGHDACGLMEHLLIPDAALLVVHHAFSPGSFGRMLSAFFSFLDSRGRKEVGTDDVRKAGEAEIVDKMDRRLAQLLEMPAGRQLNQLVASGTPYGGLAELAERCRSVLMRSMRASNLNHLVLGHGDPCFSNILYSPDIDLFRLIDPKGANDRDSAMMHPMYDVAKFSHSVLGGYDFVNCGLGECRLDSTMRLRLSLDRGGPPSWMKEAFRRKLEDVGIDIRLVRAIEASLFLSMLPLHVDSPEKLPGFCLVAGEILDELEGAL